MNLKRPAAADIELFTEMLAKIGKKDIRVCQREALTEVYGIELQPECVTVCLRNLKHWAKEHNAKWNDKLMRTHIHQGDALDDKSYIFGDEDFRPEPDMGDFSAFLE